MKNSYYFMMAFFLIGTMAYSQNKTASKLESKLPKKTEAIKGTILLNEGFESVVGSSTPPEGWRLIDADGDSIQWQTAPQPSIHIGHTGQGFMSSASFYGGALFPDNYLITPLLEGADTLNYWVCALDSAYAAEHYAICVSLSGTDTANFTIVFEETLTATDKIKGQGRWFERTLALPAGTKYIAFRHFKSTDNSRIAIDDVMVIKGAVKEELAIVADVENFDVHIYPNPVRDIITVEGKYTSLEIYSELGQLILCAKGEKQINVEKLTKGMYIVKIFNGAQMSSRKIVK